MKKPETLKHSSLERQNRRVGGQESIITEGIDWNTDRGTKLQQSRPRTSGEIKVFYDNECFQMLVYRADNKIEKNHSSKRGCSSELIIAYGAVIAELYAQPSDVPCYGRWSKLPPHYLLKTLRKDMLDQINC